jgi:hypothetical protein
VREQMRRHCFFVIGTPPQSSRAKRPVHPEA